MLQYRPMKQNWLKKLVPGGVGGGKSEIDN